MKKNERVGFILKTLSDEPGKLFTLGYFCERMDAAKSSISEDLLAVKHIIEASGHGTIETILGAGGGVLYRPDISKERCVALQVELCKKLKDPSRVLGGGFLYTSDIMFDPRLMKEVAAFFAGRFTKLMPDCIATIETKGIPVAFLLADMLNIPLTLIRRESKLSEGSTMSINYLTGASERVQKMSLVKRSVVPGANVVVVDDFMRGGGSVRGIADILNEADMNVVATGIIISSVEPVRKKIDKYLPLLYLGDIDDETRKIDVFPNEDFLMQLQ